MKKVVSVMNCNKNLFNLSILQNDICLNKFKQELSQLACYLKQSDLICLSQNEFNIVPVLRDIGINENQLISVQNIQQAELTFHNLKNNSKNPYIAVYLGFQKCDIYLINSLDDIQIIGTSVDLGIGQTLLKVFEYLNLIENYYQITNLKDQNPFQLVNQVLNHQALQYLEDSTLVDSNYGCDFSFENYLSDIRLQIFQPSKLKVSTYMYKSTLSLEQKKKIIQNTCQLILNQLFKNIQKSVCFYQKHISSDIILCGKYFEQQIFYQKLQDFAQNKLQMNLISYSDLKITEKLALFGRSYEKNRFEIKSLQQNNFTYKNFTGYYTSDMIPPLNKHQ